MPKRPQTPTNPNDGWHEIMALGGQSWGRGADAASARKELAKQTGSPVRLYWIVPKGAWVDEMGGRVEWKVDVAGEVHKDGACPLCTIS